MRRAATREKTGDANFSSRQQEEVSNAMRNGATPGLRCRGHRPSRGQGCGSAPANGAVHFADETSRKTGAVEPCFEQLPSRNSIARRAWRAGAFAGDALPVNGSGG
ncbi:hypothetical protein RGR602_CH01820 [Rhizobium gallicum bv. gallicum R602sp]|uniref:Uncharacterized protein n=1 Tax=Rhizobium gallicum bv. gallicum R602sp TaxID=1041138 RepID=A0A0B4X3P3_9HYPH|nr:hypothetical protein RGR602_CH01820 [Rhizobium gallicum bv. gallicum R602sp]